MTDTPDKNALYGDYRQSALWRDALHREASHKALDIPLPGGVSTFQDNRRSGPGILGMAAIAATGGALGIGGLLAAELLREDPPAAVETTADPEPNVDTDTSSRLRLVTPDVE